MTRTTSALAATLATVAIAAASTVYAFPGNGMGPGFGMGPGMGIGPMAGGPGPRFGAGDAVAFADQRMAALKAELKITAAQEPAWQAFAGKAREQAQAMQAMRAGMQAAAGPAPEQMAQRTEFMKARIGGMEAMTAAVKDLYAVLSPEQKALADARLGHGPGRHGHSGPRGV